MSLTTAKTATPHDARGIRGIFRLSTGQCPSTLAPDTLRLLEQRRRSFNRIFGQQTNPVDYRIWSVIQQRVYQSRVHDTDELKQCVQQVWRNVDKSIIDNALTSGTSVFVHACRRKVDPSSICLSPLSSQPYDNINVSFLSNTTRFLIFSVVICNKFELLNFPR